MFTINRASQGGQSSAEMKVWLLLNIYRYGVRTPTSTPIEGILPPPPRYEYLKIDIYPFSGVKKPLSGK
jgi:hypothetical protein